MAKARPVYTIEEESVLRECAKRMARVLEQARARNGEAAREESERALARIHRAARHPFRARR